MIRTAKSADSAAIAEIYNHYISSTVVTFEEEPVSESEMALRITETHKSDLPYLVAESEGEVVGYAYASKWKGRCAYKYSVEVTVYLQNGLTSKGWGSKLYSELFTRLKQKLIHVAMGGIALPNPASIALHEKFGMEKVAHFKEVGYKFDRWVDVAYWQVILSD